MSWSTTYHAESGIIETTLSGPLTAEDIQQSTVKAMTLHAETGATRFLNDSFAIHVHPSLSLFDIFALPNEDYKNLGVPRNSRLALVRPLDKAAQAAADFYETACLNQGWVVKAFADRQGAVDWLRANESRAVHPPKKPGRVA